MLCVYTRCEQMVWLFPKELTEQLLQIASAYPQHSVLQRWDYVFGEEVAAYRVSPSRKHEGKIKTPDQKCQDHTYSGISKNNTLCNS